MTMTETSTGTNTTPVHKTVRVNASVERAFEVFTSDFDSWWPRSHHIGKSPMMKAIIEEKAGGRCYTEQVDGTECDWGKVLAWEPPRRFVMAWQVSADFSYEAEIAKASEVEVRFTPEPGGMTRVDLEHRYFERHGPSGAMARMAVDSPNGWTGVLQLFVARMERAG